MRCNQDTLNSLQLVLELPQLRFSVHSVQLRPFPA